MNYRIIINIYITLIINRCLNYIINIFISLYTHSDKIQFLFTLYFILFLIPKEHLLYLYCSVLYLLSKTSGC